jgi:hypothetical protein
VGFEHEDVLALEADRLERSQRAPRPFGIVEQA